MPKWKEPVWPLLRRDPCGLVLVREHFLLISESLRFCAVFDCTLHGREACLSCNTNVPSLEFVGLELERDQWPIPSLVYSQYACDNREVGGKQWRRKVMTTFSSYSLQGIQASERPAFYSASPTMRLTRRLSRRQVRESDCVVLFTW